MTQIGKWEEKAWGKTRCEISTERFSRHQLKLIAGGFCSLHFHRRRANLFKVESGIVRVVRCYAWHIEADLLSVGNELVMPPLVPHQFQVIESGEMTEEYFPWQSGLSIDLTDIERLTIGGCNRDAVLAANSVILEDGTFWNHGNPS